MTYEEAIKKVIEFGLFHAMEDLPNSSKTVDAFHMVISAARKQIPQKPILLKACQGLRCPVCHCYVETGEYVYEHCEHCGQALDWSDAR